jgi:hypothetical protein
MALFCDFENIALGVRDAKFAAFDIQKVLERLLLKGSIVVKKAYCDWDRYKGFKAAMHEAAFELIEIPARAPVRQELRGHPHGGRCPGPLLHQVACRHLRDHQRRLRLLAAGQQTAREQQGRDRRWREEFHLGPADRQLRRVRLLRRPGALVKTTMQRRRPGFTESAYGYRSFRELVEDAQKHKLLAMVRDEKSGQYTIRLAAGEE